MKKITNIDFIKKAIVIHGNKYDYNKVNYSHAHIKVIITCHEHGDFSQTPANHLSGKGCPSCGIRQSRNVKCLTKEQFVQKSNSLHGNKYDYSKVIYKHSQDKVIVTCIEHGDFEQRANAHLQGQGCPNCGDIKTSNKQKSSVEEFIIKANKIHNNKYDYSKVNYINSQTKIIIICPFHGEFNQRPNDHLQKQGCPKCKMSNGEKFIMQLLSKYNIKFQNEYKLPEVVTRYEYDLFLPEYKTLIEFHGIQHYEPIEFFGGEDNLSYVKRNDEIKRHLADRYKYRLLEFNYKQFKYLSKEQFEELVINKLKIKI